MIFAFRSLWILAIIAGYCSVTSTAFAKSSCKNTSDYNRWLTVFAQEATAQGISQRTIQKALSNAHFDANVIQLDRKQHVFSQSFLKFSDRMVAQYRLNQGRKLLKKHARTFAQIEQKFGVPGPVIVAFWGLETDFGANVGNKPVLRSLATLAYDCRRPELFRPQLMDALRLIEGGDLLPSQMVGAWAGELGQTQFLPSDYYTHAIDYDGDGRRDLINSIPDVLASTANVLKQFGWQAGEPWLEEVRIPSSMPWEQADLSIRHTRAQWRKWGVTRANGQPLKSDAMPTALLLPMGRHGPAFLAFRNFDVYLEWNQSLVYAITAAYFATRLAGAPKRHSGNAKITPLKINEIKLLQHKLQQLGYDVGGIDGTIGAKTRAAVKDVQLKLGLPADSYPTPNLLRQIDKR